MPRCQFLFSAVFGSRKAVRAIFSEFDETKAKPPISLRDTRSQKGKPGGGPRPPDHRGRGQGGGRAAIWGGPPGTPSRRPFAYIFPRDAKTLHQQIILQKDSRSAAAIAKPSFGSSSVSALGTGIDPRPPSTPPPPSCSEPVEEEIDEPESSLDEKEEESDEQKEEEWISYPCQPSNERTCSHAVVPAQQGCASRAAACVPYSRTHARERGIGKPVWGGPIAADGRWRPNRGPSRSWSIKSDYGSTLDAEQRYADTAEVLLASSCPSAASAAAPSACSSSSLTAHHSSDFRNLFPRGWAGPTGVREPRRCVRALFPHARERGIGKPVWGGPIAADDDRSVAADSWSIKSDYGSTLDDEQRYADTGEVLLAFSCPSSASAAAPSTCSSSSLSAHHSSDFSFDKDVPDVVPPMLGLQSYHDGAYAEDLANYNERSHADDWFGTEVMDVPLDWTKNLCSSKDLPGCSVLDIGSGSGRLLQQLAKQGFSDLTGIDYSEAAIELAQDLAFRDGFEHINFLVGDVLESKLERKFELVMDEGTLDVGTSASQ
ncbi:hypothetical protein QYE76_049189 [Lolium multiflorum]|uniref:Methyltransferase domain-containing protein n=1 Tax=Lolium multiflorum TaxID=4521 RepID=A0AAD8WI28_LOLMU|nr:hypothetical protein QYE76_049189 [Lolium multiflorum]